MTTKEFDDLYLLHPIYPALFEQYIYNVAGTLSQHDEKPYDGGYGRVHLLAVDGSLSFRMNVRGM